MNGILKFFKQEKFFYFYAIVMSLALSLWIDWRESVINPDAICYIISAEAVTSGLKEMMHLCAQARWPLYSVLIYAVVQITHLPFDMAAYVLDGFLTAISVLTFMLIIKELGGSRKTLWLGALVILLAHDFNSVREYIIRDHGFWAFYLVSMLLMLRYLRVPYWLTGVAFNASLLIATLFRIEGVLFLLVLPFFSLICFQYPFRRRAWFFLNLNLLTVFIFFAAIIWFCLHPQQKLEKLGRISEFIEQMKHGVGLIIWRYQYTKASLIRYVMTLDSIVQADLILTLLLLVWYMVSVVMHLSFGYCMLAMYALWRKTCSFVKSANIVLVGYILVNLVITIGFFLENLFLSKRYLIALSLIFMLFVPFALQDLLSRWHNKRYRIFLCIAVCCMLISSLGGVFEFGYSKAYVRDAGNWLAKNVPASASLYANEYQLMYYSKHFDNKILYEKHVLFRASTAISNNKWKQYDYLAIRVGKKESHGFADVLQEINLKPIKVFSNKRGDQVVIYKSFR